MRNVAGFMAATPWWSGPAGMTTTTIRNIGEVEIGDLHALQLAGVSKMR